jgi:hypothetical protein
MQLDDNYTLSSQKGKTKIRTRVNKERFHVKRVAFKYDDNSPREII